MCQLSIYNSFPVIRTTIAKNRHFYIPRPSFFVCPGDALWQSRKTLHEWKDNSLLAKPLEACTHLSSFNSFPVIRTTSAKNRRFHEPQPTFFSPWRRPCNYHARCCMDGKTIQCLPNPSQHVPIYLQQFPSHSNRKCKKSLFSHTAAHIIAQYVAWMEKQFNACQTPRSM